MSILCRKLHVGTYDRDENFPATCTLQGPLSPITALLGGAARTPPDADESARRAASRLV